MALAMMLVFAGCGGGNTEITTDIGVFKAKKISFYNEYGGLKADSGKRLMVIAMEADEDFDETKFKTYFCSDDGNSVAAVSADGGSYPCVAVGVQGSEGGKDVQYALVFQVPEDAEKAKLITITAPNQGEVAIKGKLPTE
jgi:hypothetical protein